MVNRLLSTDVPCRICTTARGFHGVTRLPLDIPRGVVDFLAGLFGGSLADDLVLIGDLIDLVPGFLHRSLLTRRHTERCEQNESHQCRNASSHLQTSTEK